MLSPRIEGDVAAIKVADNQRVHAGDPLIVLDPADWRARLAQATAAAAEATAAIETAQRQVAQQQATIDAAQAAIVPGAGRAGAGKLPMPTRSGSLVAGGWASRQSNDQAIADCAQGQCRRGRRRRRRRQRRSSSLPCCRRR